MYRFASLIKRFGEGDQLNKEQGIDDGLWEEVIGPELLDAEEEGYVETLGSGMVDYPVHGMLTTKGKARRDELNAR